MASLIEELVDVLEKEADYYQQLIPLSKVKTQIIVQNDVMTLQEITEKEQLIIEQVNNLERKRVEIMDNIKIVINRKSASLNLKTLLGLLDNQPKEQHELSVLHDKLNISINQLIEINNRNKELIQESLEMIEFNMNVIQGSKMILGDNSYTKNAGQYNAKTSGSGMFDAKQ